MCATTASITGGWHNLHTHLPPLCWHGNGWWAQVSWESLTCRVWPSHLPGLECSVDIWELKKWGAYCTATCLFFPFTFPRANQFTLDCTAENASWFSWSESISVAIPQPALNWKNKPHISPCECSVSCDGNVQFLNARQEILAAEFKDLNSIQVDVLSICV